MAAQNGHKEMCLLLLARGSNVNERFSDIEVTALHHAALRGHEAVPEALLSLEGTLDWAGLDMG